MKDVLVKNVFRDNSGRLFVGGWQKLGAVVPEEIVKWYVKDLIKKGKIVEFFGFGWYGVYSVEGWLWVEEERVCVGDLGLV